MYTTEQVSRELQLIESYFNDLKNYHDTYVFPEHRVPTEIWFEAPTGHVTEGQVHQLNNFIRNHSTYGPEIDEIYKANLTYSEKKKEGEILNSLTEFEIVNIPQGNPKYDFVLICSRYYKFLFWKKSITLRIEFRAGKIISSQRTKDGLEDNTQ